MQGISPNCSEAGTPSTPPTFADESFDCNRVRGGSSVELAELRHHLTSMFSVPWLSAKARKTTAS
jgi:hypothetical protein